MKQTNLNIAEESEAQQLFFMPGLYDETLELLVKARDYFSQYGSREHFMGNEIERLVYSSEMSKITLRLTAVMAWVLAKRAVLAGQISEKDAKQSYSLDFEDNVVSPQEGLESVLPEYVCYLIEQSTTLYQRVLRLDQAETV